jgi:hypothetical protein
LEEQAMLRRGTLLLVFTGLFVIFCVGWALTTQALADGSNPPIAAEQQIVQQEISAFNPVPPPPPPPPRK